MEAMIQEMCKDFKESENRYIEAALKDWPEGEGFGSSDRASYLQEHAMDFIVMIIYRWAGENQKPIKEAKEQMRIHGPNNPHLAFWLKYRGPGYYWVNLDAILLFSADKIPEKPSPTEVFNVYYRC